MASIGSAGEGHRKASGEVVDKGSEERRDRLPVEPRDRRGLDRAGLLAGGDARVHRGGTGVGVHAPAVLLVAFVPMLLIAAAYKYLNRADPDAGTTFAWTTRALGPGTGWVNGWAIFLADVLVMASLGADRRHLHLQAVRLESAAESTGAVMAAAVVWIALMTWICYRGIELSARIQQFLLGAEIAILGVFAVVTLVKVYGNHPAGSIEPAFGWFNPFALKFRALIDGMLLGSVHLLGLGLGGGGQRGVRGPQRGAGPRGGDVDDPARADLRDRVRRRPGLHGADLLTTNSERRVERARQTVFGSGRGTSS